MPLINVPGISIRPPAVGDTTAPVLSLPTGIKTGSTTGSGTVSTDEGNGTLYYWATTSATETAAAIVASGASQAVSGTGSQAVTFSGLTASTAYYAHYVQDDAAANRSNVQNSTPAFTTDAAAAFSHYVSPSGSDTWANATSIGTPCSIETMMANVDAGDVVALRGGTYSSSYVDEGDDTQTPTYYPDGDGSSGSPITIMAYTDEVPVINGYTSTSQGASQSSKAPFGCRFNSYVIWDGITGTAPDTSSGYDTSNLVSLYQSDNCIIRNCDFTGFDNGTPASGGNAALIRIELCADIEVTNNYLHGNKGGSVNTAAIWIFRSDGLTIHHNEINCRNGIMQKERDNYQNEFYSNFIYGDGMGNGDGLLIKDQFHETSNWGSHKTYNNLIINMGASGIFMEGDQNPLVYNNTIFNCDEGMRALDDMSTIGFYDNIVKNCVDRFVGVDVPDMDNWNYNCYHTSGGGKSWQDDFDSPEFSTLASWKSNSSEGSSSIYEDPLFVADGEVAVLFTEDFDNAPTTGTAGSGNWYDDGADEFDIDTVTYYGASGASAKFEWTNGQNGPDLPTDAARRQFTPTNSVYVSYQIKHTSDWDPTELHMCFLLTTIDGDTPGLSDTFMTAYIEEHYDGGAGGSYPQINLQDSKNIDEDSIDANPGEIRAVAGCNLLFGGNADFSQGEDCYGVTNDHENTLKDRGDDLIFTNAAGANVKTDWHQVEAYFQVNSVTGSTANPDGKIRYWHDGVEVPNLSRDNVYFRMNPNKTMQWKQFVVRPWIIDGAPGAQGFWMDDLTVATGRLDSQGRIDGFALMGESPCIGASSTSGNIGFDSTDCGLT